MQKITSPQNERIKQWRKLKQKKFRQRQQAYLLEGWHSLQEGIRYQPQQVAAVLCTPEQQSRILDLLPTDFAGELFLITSTVAKKLSQTVHSEDVFAVIRYQTKQKPISKRSPWLVLDHVQDPGNAGTMVRTADAAGFSGVVFSPGSIDPWNDKVVRAMQGSQFHIQIQQPDDITTWLLQRQKDGYLLLGTLVNRQATDVRQLKLKQSRYVLIMGNEAHGLSSELAQLADQNLYLPIFGQAESLNVAVAAAVFMYHLQLNLKDL